MKQELLDKLEKTTKNIDKEKLWKLTREFMIKIPYPLLNYYINKFIEFVKDNDKRP
jgi:hypothetical protein